MGISCSSSLPTVQSNTPNNKLQVVECTVLNIYFSSDGEAFVCKTGPEYLCLQGGRVISVDVTHTKAQNLKNLASLGAVPLSSFYHLMKENFVLYIPGGANGYVSPRGNFKGIVSPDPLVLNRFKTISGGRWCTLFLPYGRGDWPKVTPSGTICLPAERTVI